MSESGSPGAPGRAGVVVQIRALVKKNTKVHLRTNALPCCSCRGPNGCVPVSACCAHVLCPIFFVAVATAVPWLIINFTSSSESQRNQFLDVQIEPPIVAKSWPGFDTSEPDPAYRTWYDGTGFYTAPQYGKYGTEYGVYTTAPPFLTPLFEKKATRSYRDWEGCEYYITSCHCQTLAIVGPESVTAPFKAFLHEQYDEWLNVSEQTAYDPATWAWPYVMLEWNKLMGRESHGEWGQGDGGHGTADGDGGNRTAVGMEPGRRRMEEGATVRRSKPRRSRFGPSREWLDPLRRLIPKEPADVGLAAPKSKRRRLSDEPSNGKRALASGDGSTDICDLTEPGGSVYGGGTVAPLACDVDDGHDEPIFRIFGSADDVDAWIDHEDYGRYSRDRTETSEMDRLCGAIIFENDALSAQEPSYSIRMNVSHGSLDVSGDFTSLDVSDDDGDPRALRWYYGGFFQLQYLVQRFIAGQRTPGLHQDAGAWDLMTAEPHFIFPSPGEESYWPFGDVVGTILGNPITLSVMFGPIVTTIAFYTSRERATRQRELMRMMGLSDSSLLLSWLIMFIALNVVISLFCSILFVVFFFKKTNLIVVWALICFFLNAILALGLMVAGVVSSDRLAAMSAFGLFVGLSFTAIAIAPHDSQTYKTVWCLVPNNAFLLGMTAIWGWEERQLGATLGRVNENIDNFSIGIALGMSFLDFWLFLALYYYFDSVAPWHNVGVPRKPWFCFQPSYWREVLGRVPPVPASDVGSPDPEMQRQTSGSLIESEEDPHLTSMVEKHQCAIIRQLCKKFRNASGHEILAVDKLDLTMYQDECFCLLGHNGAGKTTTMMMLTGCMMQSSGKIEVKGVPIPEGIRNIRSSMGFCPQHNVLIDELTVMEHLELFGTIGGMSPQALTARGKELLVAVALADKVNARSAALSGGMKRKLSCALAFLAEPYLVILDEPSSGMDPFARRGMWDTLKRWRTGHILCLTTHYMDEADALGDRIAIMGEGRLVCSGSSNFLKKRFGLGYIISFAKCNERATQDSEILHMIKGVIREVEIMSSVGKELLVQVPFAEAVHFAKLFPLLDDKKDALGIESYGTSITNLEEVFLRVAKIEGQERKKALTKELGYAAATDPLKEGEPALKQASFYLQVYALVLRRFRFGYRNPLSCCCQVGLPMLCLFFFCLTVWLSTTVALPSLVMDSTDWNIDVGSGPRVPITVGVAASLDTDSFEQLWQNVDGIETFTTSVMAQQFPEPDTPKDVLDGIAQEAGFLKEMDARKDAYEASQYGSIFYPSSSSWCPAPGVWGEYPREPLCSSRPGPTVAGNLSSRHSPATIYNFHAGAIMRDRTGGAVSKLKVSNHPFQMTRRARDNAVFVTGIFAAVIIMASYGFIPAGTTSYVVMEKEKDVKNQLIISGCSYLAYWTSNLIFDVLWGIIPCVGAIAVFHIFGLNYYITAPGDAASIGLLFGYLPSAAAFAYIVSFMFSKSGVALFASWIFYMLFGVLATTLITMLDIFASSLEGAQTASDWLRWIFRFVPVYSLGYGHLHISTKQQNSMEQDVGPFSGIAVGGAKCPSREELGLGDGDIYNEHWFCTFMVGDEFLMLWVSAVLYFVCTVVIDMVSGMPCCKKLCARSIAPWLARAAGTTQEDDDVKAEKARVRGVDVSKQFVFVDDIHKVYNGRMHAVRGISFAADEGQVFGLLGVNGAGKTTTFKMLCGQVEPSAGTVCIKGHDMKTNAAEARRLIGYCPQFDALLDSLTTKEHLELYGYLKGLKGAQLNQAVEQQLRDLDLTNYVHSRAGQLSGGNKRKTSVAMATIGEPPMVFLDEPSAGMDPVARRGMWSVIQNIAEKRKKSVVILTTHSMEEAEALCSRIAIQVDGHFRCLGTAQHIKASYGHGLELNVRLATPTPHELSDCCKKLGGISTMISNVAAAASIKNSFDGGESLFQEIQRRPGTPLESINVEVNLLAEWVLLVQRTQAFETWLVQKLEDGAQTKEVTLVCLEKSQNVARYQVTPAALSGRYKSLGELFNLFEQNKGPLKLEDFQVCQPSLEQIFNKFASTQLAQAGSQRQPAEVSSTNQAAPAAGVDADTIAAMTKPLDGQSVSAFVVDNSKLKAHTPGLGYRTAKDMGALASPGTFVGAAWGSEVRGVETGDGWLQVGQWFLPLEAQGVAVVVPKLGEDNEASAPSAQVIGAPVAV